MEAVLSLVTVTLGLMRAELAPQPLVPSSADNMNGQYFVSPTPGGAQTQPKFASGFRHYPNGTNYFDVYSPEFSTLYSQVACIY